MERDNYFTKVVFKKFPEGDVIALMIDDTWQDGQGNTLMTSYMKVGQHGAASPELLKDLQDALPRERLSLKQELNKLCGYKVVDFTDKIKGDL